MTSSTSFIDTPVCVTFKYYLFGSKVSLQLILVKGRSKSFQNVFFRNQRSQLTDNWKTFRQTVHLKSNSYYLYLKATAAAGDVAIADLQVSRGQCELDHNNFFCNFDASTSRPDTLCDWIRFRYPGDDWLTTEELGLRFNDHSTRSRFGRSLAANLNNQPKGALYTFSTDFYELYNVQGDHCLSFYYYYDDPHIDARLTVRGRDDIRDSMPWNEKAAPPGRWNYVDVDVYMAYNVELTMTVKKTRPDNQTILFDDLGFKRGKCPKRATCDFSRGFCNFESRSEIKWVQGKGRVQNPEKLGSVFTDRQVKNSLGSSSFVYVDFTTTSNNQSAVLASEFVKQAAHYGAFCLRFEYFNLGPIRNVHVIYGFFRRTTNRVTIAGDIVNGAWTSTEMNLDVEGNFNVAIQVESYEDKTFFAIRKIQLTAGRCRVE